MRPFSRRTQTRYVYQNSTSWFSLMLTLFKSSAQIAYIGWVLDSASPTKYQYAEGLFKKFLKNSPFVDLWKYYLAYVR